MKTNLEKLIKAMMFIILIVSLNNCGDEDSSKIKDTFVEDNTTEEELRGIVKGKSLYVYGYDSIGEPGNDEYFIMNVSSDGYLVEILDFNSSKGLLVEETSLNISENDDGTVFEFDIDEKTMSFSVLHSDDAGFYGIRQTNSLDIGSFPADDNVTIIDSDSMAITDGSLFPYLFSYEKLDDKGRSALLSYEDTLSFNNDIWGSDIWYNIAINEEGRRCGSAYKFNRIDYIADNEEFTQRYPDERTITVKDGELTLMARENDILTFKAAMGPSGDLSAMKFFRNIDDVNYYDNLFNLNCSF